MIMSRVKERLMKFIKEENIPVSEFERRIGVSNGYVKNISKSIQPNVLENISKNFPFLNIEWLMVGGENMRKDRVNSKVINESYSNFQANDRMMALIKFFGKSLEDVAVDVDIPLAELKEYANKEKNVTYSILKKFTSSYFGFNADWLLTGKGKIEEDAEEYSTLLDEKKKDSIPYYKDLPVSAGESGLAVINMSEKPSGFMQIPNVTAERLFPVIGCSMLPTIKQGDIIGVNKIERIDRVEPDKIYMIVTREERMLKRLRIDNDDETILWCVSDNYKEFKIYKSEIISIFHVVFHGELL